MRRHFVPANVLAPVVVRVKRNRQAVKEVPLALGNYSPVFDHTNFVRLAAGRKLSIRVSEAAGQWLIHPDIHHREDVDQSSPQDFVAFSSANTPA